MTRVLLVGLGGFWGTVLRYTVGCVIVRWKGAATFPYETLAVNALGCVAIGFLGSLSETRGLFSGTTRVFLFVGLIGGFTTFSSFGYETVQFLRDGHASFAVWSVTSQMVLGLGAVWFGQLVGRLIGSV